MKSDTKEPPFFRVPLDSDSAQSAALMAEQRGFASIENYIMWLVNLDEKRLKQEETRRTDPVVHEESGMEKLQRLFSDLSTLKMNMQTSGKLPALDWLYRQLGCRPQKGEGKFSPKFVERTKEQIREAILDLGGVVYYKDAEMKEKVINIDLHDVDKYAHLSELWRQFMTLRVKMKGDAASGGKTESAKLPEQAAQADNNAGATALALDADSESESELDNSIAEEESDDSDVEKKCGEFQFLKPKFNSEPRYTVYFDDEKAKS